jgi:hypothetical protein
MKKYDNINRYFNTIPRGWALFAVIWFGLCALGSLLLGIANMDEFGIGMILGGVLYSGAICAFFFHVYSSQFTLVKARIGKNLKKLYGMSDEELVATFEQINKEMNNARYSDVMPSKKYCTFFITNNWIIGSDGVMVYRANAVKLSNIKLIEKNYLVRSNKGGTYYYYVLQITDVKNHVYRFNLRSEENRDKAYNFLVNMFNQQATNQ